MAYEDIQSLENPNYEPLSQTFHSTSQTFHTSGQSGDKHLLSVETRVGDRMMKLAPENELSVCTHDESLPVVPDLSTSQREASDLLKSHSTATQQDRDLHLSGQDLTHCRCMETCTYSFSSNDSEGYVRVIMHWTSDKLSVC